MAEHQKDKTVKKQNKHTDREAAKGSRLIALLDRLGDAVYNCFSGGMFGKVFTSYPSLQNSFERSNCGTALLSSHKVRRFFRSGRRFIASKLESSVILDLGRRLIAYFCSLPLNFYGSFFLFFGIYTSVVYFVKMFLPGLSEPNLNYLITGICMAVSALPLTASRVPLASAIDRSMFGRAVFRKGFGFTDEMFEIDSNRKKRRREIPVLLGLLAGISSFFIDPLYIVVAIAISVLFLLVAVSPEIGVLISLVSLPLILLFDIPFIVFSTFVTVTAFLFAIKVIRGKRVFKLEIVDVFVLLFGIIIFTSEIGGISGYTGIIYALNVLSLMFGYFLIANIMRTEEWLNRCMVAIVAASSATSFIVLMEYMAVRFIDNRLYNSFRLLQAAEGSGVLTAVTVIAFPLLLSLHSMSRKLNERFLTMLLSVVSILYTVFVGTWVALVALMIGTWIFFGINHRKSFRIFAVILLALPILFLLLPPSMFNNIIHLPKEAGYSLSGCFAKWQGTLDAAKGHWFSGIGFGNESFGKVFPFYAPSGTEGALQSNSLYLQILLGVGICGLAVFCIIMFLAVQKYFSYIKEPASKSSGVFTSAVLASMAGALVLGIFDYIWYDFSAFYLFWSVPALGCAFVRVGNNDLNRKKTVLGGIEYD